MSCCSGKNKDNKVFEKLPEDIIFPGTLDSRGTVDLPEASNPPTTDQERDFARIFLDTSKGPPSQHVFLIVQDESHHDLDDGGASTRAPGGGSDGDGSSSSGLIPIVSKSEKAGQTADPEVVEEAIDEFIGVLKDNAGEGLKRWTDAELRLIIKYISVDTSYWFCEHHGLAAVFLQPKYVILLGKEGISVLSYGFVCDRADMRVEGRTPQEKRSPWLIRLEVQLWKADKLKYTLRGDGVKILEKNTQQYLTNDLKELKKRSQSQE